MAYTSLPTVAPGDPTRASWGNLVDSNLDDHETRILAIEDSLGSPGSPGGGTGDVEGPASATDNAIARFDGTTGKAIQNSGITIADGASGTLAGSNSGDVTLAGTPDYITLSGQVITRGLVDLAADVTGDLPLASLAQSASANRLLGRGSAGGAGDWEPISLGSNLSMSGSTLNAAGGSGGALDDLSDVAITTPAEHHVLQHDGSGWVNQPIQGQKRYFGVEIDGIGAGEITTGVKGAGTIPATGTITKWRILSTDPSFTAGSIEFDIRKDTYANYPPTGPDSIVASAPPTVSAANKAESSTLTGWTTSVTQGENFVIVVNSVSGFLRVRLEVEITT